MKTTNCWADHECPARPVKSGHRFTIKNQGENWRWCVLTGGMRDESLVPMPDATIHAVGKVLEHLNPVLYRVALPNGKPVFAHLSKPLTEAKEVFSIDERIVLELTLYDFDQARILGRA